MTFEKEINHLPEKCRQLLNNRDGGWQLCGLLPILYSPDQVSHGGSRDWEVCGLVLLNGQRFHEAIAVFEALYLHMLDYETQTHKHVMKGMPLVWMSDCHRNLGRPVVARRFIMLTLIEDAIAHGGTISPDRHGSYFRAAWIFGLPHGLITAYAKQAYELFQKDQTSGAYPEWILQQFDQEWLAGYPSPQDVDLYPVNRKYVTFLLNGLGDGSGKRLEFLSEYLMAIMPGCRVYRRKRSHSTDYDLVCASDDATREQMKVFQDRGIIIVVVDESDLQEIADGRNLVTVLRSRYESVRLDLEA